MRTQMERCPRCNIWWLADSSKAIAHSFEALVVLLADQLPVLRMGNLEGVGLEGEEEEEEENVEVGHV